MKRAEIKPRDWIIGVGFFMIVMAVGINVIAGANNDAPVISDNANFERFNSTFSKYEEYIAQIDETNRQVGNITGGETNPLFNFINVLFNQGWDILRQLSTNFGFLTAILTGLSGAFGIPTYITGILIAVVTAIFMFSIIAVIFNRDI